MIAPILSYFHGSFPNEALHLLVAGFATTPALLAARLIVTRFDYHHEIDPREIDCAIGGSFAAARYLIVQRISL